MSKLTTMRVGIAVISNPLSVARENRYQHRRQVEPWRDWFNLKRWKDLRLYVLKRDGYRCKHNGCNYLGIHKTHTLIAHHKKPHKGDVVLFWDVNNIETICKTCHDGLIQSKEKKDQRVGG